WVEGNANGTTPVALTALGYGPDPTNPSTASLQYNPTLGQNGRDWGPSSEHSGIVIHSYGDGHVDSISLGVDPSAYLASITARSGETISAADDR
ncbi:MAG: hypothetical protein AAF497_16635, partial [Planctomycetota bacterium]